MKFAKNALVLADSLELLERAESSIADLVYLDPPWNTESDFVYSETDLNQSERKKEYDEFLFRVVQQAHRVLKPTGNLILYSNPSLNVNFHQIISPIFTLNNFRAEFVIPRKRLTARNKRFTHNHETVIHYSKTENYFFNPTFNMDESELKEIFPLEDSKGRFRILDLTVPGTNENLSFEWQGYRLPADKIWRFSLKNLYKLLSEDKIYSEPDFLLPKYKEYVFEKATSVLSSVWDDINAYATKKGSPLFSQSEEILERIISIATAKGDLIIDPFVGTGTSLVAAKKLNRKWCGIDNSKIAIIQCKKRLKQLDEKEQYDFLEKEDLIDKKIIWDDYIIYSDSEVDVVKNKIMRGENERVEFKESLVWNHFQNKRDGAIIEKVIKEIAAFMNSKLGGSIYLGVKNDKTIVGLEKDFEEVNSQKGDSDGLDLFISDKIKNKLGSDSFNLYHIVHFIIDDKPICEIKVESSRKPIFMDTEFYTRNGSQAIKLTTEEFYKYILANDKQ